jgi:hypothetical protein
VNRCWARTSKVLNKKPSTNLRTTHVKVFTTRQVAEVLAVPERKVRRLYEDGNIPEPDRFEGLRVIQSEDIPQIVDALRRRSWIDEQASSP